MVDCPRNLIKTYLAFIIRDLRSGMNSVIGED
jgi:hypothetical protein